MIVYTEIDVDNVPDDWESLTSAGIEIAQAHDRNRWALGDLALKVERRYGQTSLKAYAGAVNIRPSTLYEYARCAAAYSKAQRAAFPALSWSHYRAALHDREHAIQWLEAANDNLWLVDELTRQIRAARGEKTTTRISFEAVCRSMTRTAEGCAILEFITDEGELPNLTGQIIKLTIVTEGAHETAT
jgi:hypothetical protein